MWDSIVFLKLIMHLMEKRFCLFEDAPIRNKRVDCIRGNLAGCSARSELGKILEILKEAVISHLKECDPDDAARADEVLALVESARRAGVSANAEGTADAMRWRKKKPSLQEDQLLAFGGGKLDNSGERQCRLGCQNEQRDRRGSAGLGSRVETE
jgi:hypothetical protein